MRKRQAKEYEEGSLIANWLSTRVKYVIRSL